MRRERVAAVLVSLKPEFATAMAEGRKRVELRRRFPAVTSGVRLLIYVTKPVGAVVGSAPIEAIESASIETIWRRHRGRVALTRARFDEYFASRSRGYAVVLGRFEPIGPVSSVRIGEIIPGFRPPQSWQYVDDTVLAELSAKQPESDVPADKGRAWASRNASASATSSPRGKATRRRATPRASAR